MRQLAPLLACLALALSGCATAAPPPPAGGLTQPARISDRAMAAAELAYNVPARLYLAAYRQGLISAGQRDEAKAILARAHAALVLARAAYRANDAPTFAARVSEMQGFLASVLSMIPTAAVQ